jgi:hypothetical protein
MCSTYVLHTRCSWNIWYSRMADVRGASYLRHVWYVRVAYERFVEHLVRLHSGIADVLGTSYLRHVRYVICVLRIADVRGASYLSIMCSICEVELRII